MNNGLGNDSEIDFGDGHDMIGLENRDGEIDASTQGEHSQSGTANMPASVFSLRSYADTDCLTREGMCQVFSCAERTVYRMVERYEIPPPITLGGRNVWIVGRLKGWIDIVAQHHEQKAMNMAKKLNILRL